MLLFGQSRRGADKVDLSQALDAAVECVGLLADFLAQRAQDAFDLTLFVKTQGPPAIAHFDRRQGFDEQRRATGGLVVDDAGYLAA